LANPRIDDLRKRLEKEPGSRIFAQLAEELRKDGDLEEAIQVCREGLQKHSNYPSARMTLGRALFESGDLAAARREFEVVLKGAPDNILASRLLGESLEGLGELEAARDRFKAALAMAPGEKHVAAQLEAVERALKRKAPPTAAVPAPAARESPAAAGAAAEPPPIKLVEVNEPMELERPHEAATVSFRPPEPPPASPEPPRPVAQEEVVEFDPTLAGTATQAERPAPQALPAEGELPTTLPLGTRAPTFPEPGPPPAPAVFTTPPAPAPERPLEVEPEVEAEQPSEPPAAPAPAEVAQAAPPAPPPPMPETPLEVKAPVSGPAPTEEIASVTLAELYFNQGFADKAVAVLKQLLIREPGNERARARLTEIEAREARLQVEQAQVAAATGPGVDQRALRRQAIQRTIAQLEKMLKAVRKG